MHNRLLILALILLFAPSALGDLSPVQFTPPAQYSGEILGGGDGRIFLFFSPSSFGHISLTIDATTQLDRFSHTYFESRVAEGVNIRDNAVLPGVTAEHSSHSLSGNGSLTLRFGGHYGAVVIEGSGIEIQSASAAGQLSIFSANSCISAPSHFDEDERRMIRSDYCPGTDETLLTIPGKQALTFRAEKVNRFDWVNAAIVCSGLDGCPPTTYDERSTISEGPHSTEVYTRTWFSLTPTNPAMANGSFETKLGHLLGPTLTTHIGGSLRLPKAAFASCPNCTSGDETVTLEGNLQLLDLSSQGAGRLGGLFSGHEATIRIDETTVESHRLLGLASPAVVTGVAITTILAALFKFLLPLTTRLSSDDALRHPRRQLLMSFIEEKPGATFREVIRETGVPAGTARHHLTILRRSGAIMEKRHRSTLRYFENHGRYEQTWSREVLLREEPLQILHSWLMENKTCRQGVILDAMRSILGWSRSTTQHRLERLVDGGLVTVRPQGRLKLYTAHEEPQAPRRAEPAWMSNSYLYS